MTTVREGRTRVNQVTNQASGNFSSIISPTLGVFKSQDESFLNILFQFVDLGLRLSSLAISWYAGFGLQLLVSKNGNFSLSGFCLSRFGLFELLFGILFIMFDRSLYFWFEFLYFRLIFAILGFWNALRWFKYYDLVV